MWQSGRIRIYLNKYYNKLIDKNWGLTLALLDLVQFCGGPSKSGKLHPKQDVEWICQSNSQISIQYTVNFAVVLIKILILVSPRF